MSQRKDEEGSLGYQKKSSGEVDQIVTRLNTPKKTQEPKKPKRQRQVSLK
jgi:hypothetical protein